MIVLTGYLGIEKKLAYKHFAKNGFFMQYKATLIAINARKAVYRPLLLFDGV